VTITNSGQIQTYGDWSSGILAQSIGGGGGKGGTAVSANTEANPTLSIDVGVGGAGGDGGDGGSVTIDLDSGSSIMTSGYGAFGIHAQSIGGGGGIGADGSMTGTGTIQVGGDVSGSGGNFGDSGGVTLSGDAIVTTTGDAAHAIVLQSIGGGGGVGGQGSSLDLATGSPDPAISLSVGGGQDSEGVAGAVQLNGTVNISTTGWASYGILAQSIGGGGGLAWTPEEGQDLEVNPIQVGGNGSLGDSGGVSITLSAGSTIYTTGLAAHGIVAQAIGGGGGIAGYPSSDGAVYYSDGIDFDGVAPSGTAESPVAISVDGIIQTTGDGAHGIFAQSIGGGGGFRGYESSVDMGTVSAPGSNGSLGGEISITQSGTISASGYNSVGILAQQAAPSESGSTVEITINGSVTGGSGDGGSETDGSGGGYGVWIIANTSGESTLTINSGGSLSAASGNAARFDNSDSGPGVLYNYGDVSGSVVGFTDSSGAEAVQVNNYSTGRFFTGSRVEANVYNEGQIFVGRGIPGGGYGQTVITGDFVQASGGTLIFRTDFERGQNDSLVVEGDADLNGRVRPQPVPGARIVPYRRLTLLTVDGEISGRLYLDGSLGGIFDYDLRQSANTYTIAVTGIDLAGLDPTFSENQLMMAEYLEEIFLAGSGGLDIFGTLDALSRTQSGQIGTFFDELTPGATLGFGAFGSTEAQYFSDSVLNGPIFEGSTATLAESPSAWIRAHGRITSQRFPDGYSNYDIDSMMYQTGGQAAIADNTYLGGSIAYRDDSLRSDNHITSGSGDTALGAVTLKHETGPWLLEGALSGSLGWYETSRQINFPGEEAVAEASPQVQTAALAFRVAYLHAYEKVYLRPLVTMTGVYTHSSSYTESGAGAFDLSVDSAEESTLFFTPAFEVGARTDFSNDTIMRSFVRPGVVFASNDSWEQDARFVGSPESVGDFTTRLPLDDISGTVVAGIDFQFNESSSAHIRYEGRFSENVSSNGGSIGLKITF
tara:strand:- start:542 stop:3523 length:2982 start_codon:yes stop_codon:yes gene_type:complete